MRAVVLPAVGQALEVRDHHPEAGTGRDGGEIVDVTACGVCHSDLHVVDGEFPSPLPLVLGHEVTGVHPEMGPVMVYAPWGCGACRQCRDGEEMICADATEAGLFTDGLRRGLGLSWLVRGVFLASALSLALIGLAPGSWPATLASAGANIVLSLILFWLIAERGIALATTLAGWLNAGLLFAGLYRKGQWQIDRELLKRTALVLVCSLLMGGVLIVEMIELGDWLQPSSALTTQILAIGILVASAMAISFAMALATGAPDRRLFLAVLKRKRPPPPPAAS